MTMLELYHHGSSVCAAKVHLYLGEKGLDAGRIGQPACEKWRKKLAGSR